MVILIDIYQMLEIPSLFKKVREKKNRQTNNRNENHFSPILESFKKRIFFDDIISNALKDDFSWNDDASNILS